MSPPRRRGRPRKTRPKPPPPVQGSYLTDAYCGACEVAGHTSADHCRAAGTCLRPDRRMCPCRELWSQGPDVVDQERAAALARIGATS